MILLIVCLSPVALIALFYSIMPLPYRLVALIFLIVFSSLLIALLSSSLTVFGQVGFWAAIGLLLYAAGNLFIQCFLFWEGKERRRSPFDKLLEDQES